LLGSPRVEVMEVLEVPKLAGACAGVMRWPETLNG
jgi:hypothetical protein